MLALGRVPAIRVSRVAVAARVLLLWLVGRRAAVVVALLLMLGGALVVGGLLVRRWRAVAGLRGVAAVALRGRRLVGLLAVRRVGGLRGSVAWLMGERGQRWRAMLGLMRS